jgi:hypothetical protein
MKFIWGLIIFVLLSTIVFSNDISSYNATFDLENQKTLTMFKIVLNSTESKTVSV